jgi:signal transduction histidine kinase
MRSKEGSVSQAARGTMTQFLVYEGLPTYSAELTEILAARGYKAARIASAAEAEASFRGALPELVVVFEDEGAGAPEPGAAAAVRLEAQRLGIPVLVVVDEPSDAIALADRLTDTDDWVSVAGLATELPARAARLMRRRSNNGRGNDLESRGDSEIWFSPQLLSLIIHDLRTPLNVIGLSLRMVNHSIPKGDPDLDQDLRFLEENFNQIVRMLAQLSDFHRLHNQDPTLDPIEFSPRRLVEEMVEGPLTGSGSKAGVSVEVLDTCPTEVALDPLRARLALQYALTNALNAAEGKPVRVVLRGGEGRWVTEMVVDQPPPDTVKAVDLSPLAFERLCGSARERRGMDLAIAAKVSEFFGGSAGSTSPRAARPPWCSTGPRTLRVPESAGPCPRPLAQCLPRIATDPPRVARSLLTAGTPRVLSPEARRQCHRWRLQPTRPCIATGSRSSSPKASTPNRN